MGDLSEKVCERKVVGEMFNGVWKEDHIFPNWLAYALAVSES